MLFLFFWGPNEGDRKRTYIPRLFSEYMLTFRVEEPMKMCVTNQIRNILFLIVTRSCKNSGLFLCIIVKVPKAIVLILRVLSEDNLEFWSSVSYELSESLQINRRACSCICSIQKCQVSGH
jgi:hypothetical protein